MTDPVYALRQKFKDAKGPTEILMWVSHHITEGVVVAEETSVLIVKLKNGHLKRIPRWDIQRRAIQTQGEKRP